MARARLGNPAAVATYVGRRGARHAIEKLEAVGVDGDDIVMLDATPAASTDRSSADRALARHAGLWILLGAIAGAAVGALIGAVFIGAVVLAWPGSLAHPWPAWSLGTAFVASAGATVGGFIALARKTGFSDAWEQTFSEATAPEADDDADAIVHIAVFGDRDRVCRALETTTPIRIEVEPGHGYRRAG
jgi:hypothetical protein